MKKGLRRAFISQPAFFFLALSLVFIALILSSCSSPKTGVSSSRVPTLGEVSQEAAPTQKTALRGEKDVRYLIKNRTISLEVKNLSQTARKIEKLATKYGGYVSSQNLSVAYPSNEEPLPLSQAVTSGAKDFLQGYMEVRVPVVNFGRFSQEVKQLGQVINDVIESQEVTQEYVDLKARLKNLEREEAQYLKILEKSGKIADILAVERELERVRSEIESLKSQQMVLEKSIEMATIRVELKKEEGLISPPPAGWGFKEAWHQAIKNFVGSVNNLIILTGSILPYLIALAVLYYLLRIAAPYLNRLSLRKKKAGSKKGS